MVRQGSMRAMETQSLRSMSLESYDRDKYVS